MPCPGKAEYSSRPIGIYFKRPIACSPFSEGLIALSLEGEGRGEGMGLLPPGA